MCPAEDSFSEHAGAMAKTILVVEDEVLVRMNIADHLREQGFIVLEAATAEEARSVLLAGVQIDLVFSDIMMPGAIDGAGLADWLVTHNPNVPIILASGVESVLDEAAARHSQVKRVMVKPYDQNSLAAEIVKILSD